MAPGAEELEAGGIPNLIVSLYGSTGARSPLGAGEEE
jgi:hypothetical protein